MIEESGSTNQINSHPSLRQSIEANIERNLEIAAVLLLSIATVATAWCAYQSTRWGGVQATSFAQASAKRIESSREYNRSMQLVTIDANLFAQWVAAYNVGDQALLTFYETNLMRPEFMPYLDAWVASNPLQNPDSARNPLVDQAYLQTMFAESERLRTEAEAKFVEATEANQNGDDYVLATVMFASVLFFGGISSKFKSRKIQKTLVTLAILMFAIGLTQIGGLPIH